MILSEPTQLQPTRNHIFGQFLLYNNFALYRTTTAHRQSDVEFNGESYGAYHVTAARWTKNFLTKNIKKVEKIMNIQEYSKKIQHFFALLDAFFHMNKSKI